MSIHSGTCFPALPPGRPRASVSAPEALVGPGWCCSHGKRVLPAARPGADPRPGSVSALNPPILRGRPVPRRAPDPAISGRGGRGPVAALRRRVHGGPVMGRAPARPGKSGKFCLGMAGLWSSGVLRPFLQLRFIFRHSFEENCGRGRLASAGVRILPCSNEVAFRSIGSPQEGSRRDSDHAEFRYVSPIQKCGVHVGQPY